MEVSNSAAARFRQTRHVLASWQPHTTVAPEVVARVTLHVDKTKRASIVAAGTGPPPPPLATATPEEDTDDVVAADVPQSPPPTPTTPRPPASSYPLGKTNSVESLKELLLLDWFADSEERASSYSADLTLKWREARSIRHTMEPQEMSTSARNTSSLIVLFFHRKDFLSLEMQKSVR